VQKHGCHWPNVALQLDQTQLCNCVNGCNEQTSCVFAMQPMMYSLANTDVQRPQPRSKMTVYELRLCAVATGI
jgi:hypothetical protein